MHSQLQTQTSMSREILLGQLRWASSVGVEVAADGLLAHGAEQWLMGLSEETRRELAASTLGLEDRPGKPGALSRLDSTHALLCHLVEPLRGAGAGALDAALGGRGDARSIALCVGLGASAAEPGAGPSGEVELMLDGPRPTFVLAGFREPYESPRSLRPADPDVDGPGDDWRSLSGCRGLALDLRANASRFAHLEVARALEATRLLTRRFGPRGFRLALLWQDGATPEARRLAREIDRLRARIGGDVDLVAASWGGLFDRLRAAGVYEPGYAERLAHRYFPS